MVNLDLFVVCSTLVSLAMIGGYFYYQTKIQAAEIQQQGIDRRAGVSSGKEPWYSWLFESR